LAAAEQAAKAEKLRKCTEACDQEHGTSLWQSIKRVAAMGE